MVFWRCYPQGGRFMNTPKMTKTRAKELLQKSVDTIHNLKQLSYDAEEFTKWKRDTEIAIERIFSKDTRNLSDFLGIQYTDPQPGFTMGRWGEILEHPRDERPDYVHGLKNAKSILESMIGEIDTYWEDEPAVELRSDQPAKESIQQFSDRDLMLRAIELARNCVSESGKISPKLEPLLLVMGSF